MWTDLELENKIHPVFTQRVDIVEDQRDDDIDAVTLVAGDGVLVFVTRSLAVFREALQSLVDQRHVVLVNVEA